MTEKESAFSQKRFRCFLLGKERSEFSHVLDDLERWTCWEKVEPVFFVSGEKVYENKTTPPPDLFLLFQAFPGEYSPALIARLRSLFPFTPLLFVLGDWCSGMMRTGEFIPANSRLYAHQWIGQGRRKLEALLNGQPSAFRLPLTSGDDEIALFEMEKSTPVRTELSGPVDHPRAHLLEDAWFGTDRDMNSLLFELLEKNGMNTTRGRLESLHPKSGEQKPPPEECSLLLVIDLADAPPGQFPEAMTALTPAFSRIHVVMLAHPPVESPSWFHHPHPVFSGMLLTKPFQIEDFRLALRPLDLKPFRCSNKIV